MKKFQDLFASPTLTQVVGIGVGLLLVAGVAQAATTISTSITTGGSVTSVGVTSTGDVVVNGLATTTAASGNIATQGNLSVKGTSTLGSAGSAVTNLLFGTCSVTPGAVTAGTSTTATCTATGVASGDKVFVTAPTTANSTENWLVPMGATAGTNAITIQIMNASSTATVTGAARTWSWMSVR